MRIIWSLIFIAVTTVSFGQAIFAHNDYVKTTPFYTAFQLKVSYIEADIFLEKGEILVAHTKAELNPENTLESMYLKPLAQKSNELYDLNLMIDLKSEGHSTLDALVKLLNKFPQLTSSEHLHFVISGSYPPPVEWKKYPSYIFFDGRPNITYTTEQSRRLKLISTSFSGISKWDGKGPIPKTDLDKIKRTIAIAHKYKMPMRFWGSPDDENAWDQFIKAGVDVLNSDHIEELSAYLDTRR